MLQKLRSREDSVTSISQLHAVQATVWTSYQLCVLTDLVGSKYMVIDYRNLGQVVYLFCHQAVQFGTGQKAVI